MSCPPHHYIVSTATDGSGLLWGVCKRCEAHRTFDPMSDERRMGIGGSPGSKARSIAASRASLKANKEAKKEAMS